MLRSLLLLCCALVGCVMPTDPQVLGPGCVLRVVVNLRDGSTAFVDSSHYAVCPAPAYVSEWDTVIGGQAMHYRVLWDGASPFRSP